MKDLKTYFENSCNESAFDIDKDIDRFPAGYEFDDGGILDSVTKDELIIKSDKKRPLEINENTYAEYCDLSKEYNIKTIRLLSGSMGIEINPSKNVNFNKLKWIVDVQPGVNIENILTLSPKNSCAISNFKLESFGRGGVDRFIVFPEYGKYFTLKNCSLDIHNASMYSGKFPLLEGNSKMLFRNLRVLDCKEPYDNFREDYESEEAKEFFMKFGINLKYFPKIYSITFELKDKELEYRWNYDGTFFLK